MQAIANNVQSDQKSCNIDEFIILLICIFLDKKYISDKKARYQGCRGSSCASFKPCANISSRMSKLLAGSLWSPEYSGILDFEVHYHIQIMQLYHFWCHFWIPRDILRIYCKYEFKILSTAICTAFCKSRSIRSKSMIWPNLSFY